MAQFTIYSNTDGSAPAVSGTAGSLVALLDACLVNGYGAKAAAGWTKPFTGTNKAAFRQGAGSNQMYLRVQDDAPGAGGAQEARITGYESMTSVDAGTNPFPSAAQGVGGIAMLVARKSTTSDGTARDWIVAADSRTAYVFIKSQVAAGVAHTFFPFAFGEFYSFKPDADPYRVFIQGRNQENSSAGLSSDITRSESAPGNATAGHYMPRAHTGTYGPIQLSKTSDILKNASTGAGSGVIPYTNQPDGKIYVAPYWLSNTVTAPAKGLFGRMRGIWLFLHPAASVNHGDTFSGAAGGLLDGKTFLIIKTLATDTAFGVAVLETSDTIETN